MAASAAGALALEWVAEAEEIRLKSPNIQGKFSGHLKRNFKKLHEIIRSLVGKADAAGDPLFLRMRNGELTQLSESKAANKSSREELTEANKRIKELQT